MSEPRYSQSRVVVTGASGFIGRALCAKLASRGDTVCAVIRNSGARASQFVSPGVRVVHVDGIGPNTDWRTIVGGDDVVVHLAGRAHVLRERVYDPLSEFRRVNVDGTLALARHAAAVGVRRFVFASSVGVSGTESTDRPLLETDPTNPQEPYAVSKWEAELGLTELAGHTGMEVTIVRPPLVIGANAPGNFGRLYRLVKRGLPLPLGAVHNRRSMVGLDNLLDFFALCVYHPEAADETFFVSDGEDLSTTELVCRLAAAMRRPVRLLNVQPRVLMAGASLLGRRELISRLTGSLQIDTSKARRKLGWLPPFSVDDGIRRSVVGP